MKKMTLSKLKLKLQDVFNKFIRLRDKGNPCISCGKIKTLQAGHFYTVKNTDAFRFDERNVHGECSGCNCFDGDHIHGYAKLLEKKIGKLELHKLDTEVAEYKKDRNNLKYKWYRHDIEEKILYYKQKIKELNGNLE